MPKTKKYKRNKKVKRQKPTKKGKGNEGKRWNPNELAKIKAQRKKEKEYAHIIHGFPGIAISQRESLLRKNIKNISPTYAEKSEELEDFLKFNKNIKKSTIEADIGFMKPKGKTQKAPKKP